MVGSLGSLVNSNCTWKKFREIYGNQNSDLVFAHNLIKKLRKNFPDLFVFNISSLSFQSLLTQDFRTILVQFKKYVQNNKEPPSGYDVNLWNKLNKMKQSGTLEQEINNVLKLDKSTLQVILNNIENNKEKIIQWADRNYFSGNVIINFLNKLGEYYLFKPIVDNNLVLEWAKGFSSNFNKYLSEYTMDEKIIRSFLFGKQYQFTFRHNHNHNLIQTIMNYDIFVVNINRNRFSEEETLIKLPSNFYFYYIYLEDEKSKMETNQTTIKVSWLSHIEPKWLVPTFPIFFSHTFNDVIMRIQNNEEPTIEFINSQTLKKLQKQITNNWNQEYNIWDDEKTPILREFYRSITKHLSYGS